MKKEPLYSYTLPEIKTTFLCNWSKFSFYLVFISGQYFIDRVDGRLKNPMVGCIPLAIIDRFKKSAEYRDFSFGYDEALEVVKRYLLLI